MEKQIAVVQVSDQVAQYARNISGAVLTLMIGAAFELKPAIAAGTRGAATEYARALVLKSGDAISEKYAIKLMTISKKLLMKHDADFTQWAAQGVNHASVMEVLRRVELAATMAGYNLHAEDISAYCDGAPSQAATREAARKAAAEAADKAAAAEANAKKAAEDAIAAAAADSNKRAADAEAAAAAAQAEAARLKEENDKAAEEKKATDQRAAQLQREKDAQAKRAREAEAEAEAKRAAEAEAARKLAESVCITVKVQADGSPLVCMAANQSPEFLKQVAGYILTQALEIEAAREAAMAAQAPKRKAKREKQVA